MTVLNDSLNLGSPEFIKDYQMIMKVKFLRDVATCTFIEISTEAVFNEVYIS